MTNPKTNTWEYLCSSILDYLAQLKYSPGSISHFSSGYRKFLKYLREKKKLDSPILSKYTDAYLRNCGIPDSKSSQTSLPRMQRKRRYEMRILLEYHEKGEFERNTKKKMLPPIPASFERLLERYRDYHLELEDIKSEKCLYWHIRGIREFLCLLCDHKIFNIRKVRFEHIQAFFKKKSCFGSSRISHLASNFRSFFRFLIKSKLVNPKLIEAIPHGIHSNIYRVPAVWTRDDIQNFLSTIDKTTGIGKRNYAICLLVSRLGLRIGDIRALQLENINWRKSVIYLTQEKTRNDLELPMSAEIGDALIDYLKNGRPETSSRHIFVTHKAPYQKFGINYNLYAIVRNGIHKAGKSFPTECHKGFHSLRHSIATRLHEENTPLSVIASLLGHVSLDATRRYARTNINALRSVALEWEE